jgi:NAD(P)-dependent dehydrogenase (short-subunit alcohol dehydrogenase family)
VSATSGQQGPVVLVSGAGSGIGQATAVELHRRGARLLLFDIDEAGLRQTCGQAGGSVPFVVGDVTRPADCEATAAAALQAHGRIDVVWANAGIASFGPLAHTDPAAFARCIEVNVMGCFHTVRAALPAVMQSRGFVAVTASVASFAHAPMMSAYAGSKAAVEAMCNAWRQELAPHGVGVGAIHAHWVSTPLVSEGSLHPAFARMRQAMPAAMNRELPAADAARLIADGLLARHDRIWVPGWVRWMHRLRALLHTRLAERDMQKAVPDLEALYLQGLAAEGRLASSYGPRERERAQQRGEA